MRRALIILLALPVAGCDWQTFKSSVAGSCAVFERPPYVVLGKTRYDQDVADKFVESGVAGCNWPRPAVRPAALDVSGGKVAAAAPRKPGLIQRIRDRVRPPAPQRSPQPSWPPVAAPIAPAPVAPPAVVPPAPAPRSKLDQLLHPQH